MNLYTDNGLRAIAGIKDNHYCSLSNDAQELLDITNPYANKCYQNGLELVFLYALNKLGYRGNVINHGSFNKGLYLELTAEANLKAVKKEMNSLIKKDINISYANNIAGIDDYKANLYGGMLNSTADIYSFELVKYKKGCLLRYPDLINSNEIKEYPKQLKLAQMFEDEENWGKRIGIETIADLNNAIKENRINDIILKQEIAQQSAIDEITKKIKMKNKRLVLICGPSSSGKTSFAKRVCLNLEMYGYNTLYMGTDDYYVEIEQMPKNKKGEYDYECIEAIDVKLFQKNINELLNGQEADLPVFDFESQHKKFGTNSKKISDDTIIVIEGILTLNKKLTANLNSEDMYKIYISPVSAIRIDDLNRLSNTDIRLARRMIRDKAHRNAPITRTIELWPKVRTGEEINIFPSIDEADCFFNSYSVYEQAVIAKYILPLLKEVANDDKTYPEVERLIKHFEMFEQISDESCVLNNSILREFIGGSVIVD